MPSNPHEFRLLNDTYRYTQGTLRARKPRRLVFFLSVFLASLLITQLYVFTRPAVYISEATLLTTAATDIDKNSAESDLQHVNIQKQLLLGQAMLDKTAELLNTHPEISPQTPNDLSRMFSVSAIDETNLLNLQATGPDPELLQKALNAWIEVYRQSRTEYIADNSDKAQISLNEELARTEQQVENKRQEIDVFRIQHDILSENNDINSAPALLQGLNESLNNAMEEEIKAKTKMDAIHNALAHGKTVVPEDDSQALAFLTQQAEQLRQKLEGLRGQYTDEYIQFNPTLRKVVEELAVLDGKIAEKIKKGQAVAVEEAENDYAAAHEAVISIQKQLDHHKKIAATYTGQFAKYQTLQSELEALTVLQQETKQRLVDIDVKQRRKYPQMEIINSASLPGDPVSPDYWLNSAIALAASVALGFFSVLLSEYLCRETRQPEMEAVTVKPLGYGRRQILANPRPAEARIRNQALKALENEVSPRELTHDEVEAIFETADLQVKVFLTLLLNGLFAEEILALTADCFDFNMKIISAPTSPRKLPMTRCTLSQLTSFPWQPVNFNADEFDAMIHCTAIDAGLFQPEQINAKTINYTYILFLIRQGIKLADLRTITGPINPQRLKLLGEFSPGFPGLPLESIDREYLKNF